MERVQLFATCLGDLVVRRRGRGRGDAPARGRVRGRVPGRQVCCGQPAFNSGHRGAARRVARTFARAFSRDAADRLPVGLLRDDGCHYLPELLGAEPFEVWELSAFLVQRASRARAAERGPAARLPRLVPHAPRAADRRRSRGACSSARARRSSRSPRPGSLLRLRRDVLGPPAGGVAGDGRRQARRRRARRRARHRRPGLPDAPARPRGARRHGVRIVHLATALARGIDG